ncbi:hypothetical protein P170DRAFT_244319 [Aspergillus steynii IBT 23096]|uniref:Uncharacterized protein n=1 Tax=Aspergillus steynii IBT 23096 TaxID=1392250 RepID=A0A2I2FXU8_9EURO|nr:uncharacterized protein P170DRAFT_244319 [Aspergillus steynii IBT 23096]PLB45454.1 hypothetical protein P170DRAFT_244319 [Aspergillus steynii IBT 23096]
MGIFSWLCCIPSSPSPPPLSASPQPRPHSTTTTASNAPNTETGYTSPTGLPAYTPRPVSIHEKTLELHMRDPPISSTSAPDQHQHSYPDEKAPYRYSIDHPAPGNRPEDLSSDVSSAISFTSSYGNTSTATRDTPPPPYSPRDGSPVPSRSQSVSSGSGPGPGMVSMGWAVGTGTGSGGGGPAQIMQIAQPRPVFQRQETLVRSLVARRSVEEQVDRRRSCEGRGY